MKKFLSIMLVALIVATCASLTSCGKNAETLKFGLGVYSTYGTVRDADGEMDGSGQVVTTAVALLLDGNGKIVKCAIDTADNTINFTSSGASVPASEFKTKGEMGDNYGMVAYGGATLEWYEQAAAFCKVAEGKTIDQVKALLVDGYNGNDEVIAAGCTIGIADFVYAVEKAAGNAADSSATSADTLSVSFVSAQDKAKDASEDGDGSCEVVMTICAAATNGDGKISAIKTDSVSASFSFSADGASTTDTTAALSTKRELGTDYNMAKYGADLNGDGIVKEWFEQADAFDAACLGKNADEIAALAVDGYGVESLQSAGCTIGVSDMVAGAVKAAK